MVFQNCVMCDVWLFRALQATLCHRLWSVACAVHCMNLEMEALTDALAVRLTVSVTVEGVSRCHILAVRQPRQYTWLCTATVQYCLFL
jgi:hypothetical protein